MMRLGHPHITLICIPHTGIFVMAVADAVVVAVVVVVHITIVVAQNLVAIYCLHCKTARIHHTLTNEHANFQCYFDVCVCVRLYTFLLQLISALSAAVYFHSMSLIPCFNFSFLNSGYFELHINRNYRWKRTLKIEYDWKLSNTTDAL